METSGNTGVPAGKAFIIANGIPNPKSSRPIPGKTHFEIVTENATNRFEWASAEITMPRHNKISSKCTVFGRKTINIYRYEDDIDVPYSIEDDSADDDTN